MGVLEQEVKIHDIQNQDLYVSTLQDLQCLKSKIKYHYFNSWTSFGYLHHAVTKFYSILDECTASVFRMNELVQADVEG